MSEKARPVSPRNGVPLPEGRKFTPGEKAREAGRKGGISSGNKKRERKTLREELLRLLEEKVPGKDGSERPAQEAISTALMKQAMKGNIRAYEIIRDTIGEKPVENVNVISPDYSALNEAFSDLRRGLEDG